MRRNSKGARNTGGMSTTVSTQSRSDETALYTQSCEQLAGEQMHIPNFNLALAPVLGTLVGGKSTTTKGCRAWGV